MIDSGASSLFLSQRFVSENHVSTKRLPRPIPLHNIDNTLNAAGYITHTARLTLQIDNHEEEAEFAVTDIGPEEVIIGIEWLRTHNPEINWKQGSITMSRCPKKCRRRKRGVIAPTKHTLAQDWDILDEDEYSEERRRKEEEDQWTSEIEEGDVIFSCKAGFSLAPSHAINAGFTVSQQLAQEAHKDDVKKSFEDMVPPQYRDYHHIFSKKASERFPLAKPWDHAIDLKPGTTPPFSKIYPMNLTEQKHLDEFLEENLQKGYIIPSKSPAGAPVFFVKKKDGSLRLCQDYRALNEITIKNRYPLPLIPSLIDKLQGMSIFTKLDIRWGYNNVRIKTGDRWKAAFRTHKGLFEPTVMFFGLTNSPGTFQEMMNDIFKDMPNVIVYLDDILIFSKNQNEHRKIVREVLKRLKDNDLFLKPEKCEFEKSSIEYLGLLISREGISMDPVKLEGVQAWPTPKSVKDVRTFLGFSNFYRRFIVHFARTAEPLNRLLKKDTKWLWTQEHQEAFEGLKAAFMTAPVLILPDPEKQFWLEADASNFAWGAVLSQMGEDGKLHPVAFQAKSFNEAERNYEIYDKELLAIIRALEEWQVYLEGGPHVVQVWSDHQNLKYFRTARNLTRRQARWSLFLSRFNFQIAHRPGTLSGKPDALSRRPDLAPTDIDNREQTMLKTEIFKINATRRGHASAVGDHALLNRIRNSTSKDQEVAQAIDTLQVHGPRKLANGLEEWNTEDGLILYRGRVYVPKDPDLRRDLVKIHHDSLVAGHPGRWKTYELASRNYWWPGMSRFVHAYVDGCEICARTKTFPQKPRGALLPNPVPDRPWGVISLDLITDLPASDGFDSILNVVDRLTKTAHSIPTTKTVDTNGMIDLYINHIWRYHGLPDVIISDRGPQFASKFMQALLERLGTNSALSTAFHPQTDGQTERYNQEIEQYLRVFCNYRQTNWPSLLPYAEFCLNNRHHSAINTSPFKALYGYDPAWTVSPAPTTVPAATDRLAEMIEIQKEAKASLEIAAQRMKLHYDRHVQDVPPLEVGSKVWLEAKNITTTQPSKKLADKRLGPFEIIDRVGILNYRLKLPPGLGVHPVFHISLLTPHHTDEIEGRNPPAPQPIEIEGQEEHLVEEVLDSRRRGRGIQYLVKWEGYDRNENSWEPSRNLPRAQEAIRDFHQAHPDAPAPKSLAKSPIAPKKKTSRRRKPHRRLNTTFTNLPAFELWKLRHVRTLPDRP
jgi:predicted aspartyl protease